VTQRQTAEAGKRGQHLSEKQTDKIKKRLTGIDLIPASRFTLSFFSKKGF
jgi:hypothetical protein